MGVEFIVDASHKIQTSFPARNRSKVYHCPARNPVTILTILGVHKLRVQGRPDDLICYNFIQYFGVLVMKISSDQISGT